MTGYVEHAQSVALAGAYVWLLVLTLWPYRRRLRTRGASASPTQTEEDLGESGQAEAESEPRRFRTTHNLREQTDPRENPAGSASAVALETAVRPRVSMTPPSPPITTADQSWAGQTRCALDPHLISDFNALAADPSVQAVETFAARWRTFTIKPSGGEVLVQSEDGHLWFVPDSDSSSSGTVLPGPELIQKWDKFYKSLAGASALDQLGPTYRLEEGASLAVKEPCIGYRQGLTVRVEKQGRLTGL